MKQNKIQNIIFLFISHTYIYSFIYLLINEGIVLAKTDYYTVYFDKFEFSNSETYFTLFKDFILMLLFSPFSLIFIEGLYFILAPPIIFLLLKMKFPKIKEFKIYIISVISTTALIYILLLWFKSDNNLKIIVMRYDGELEYNKLYFMIPSLLVSILLNKIIFRNKLYPRKNVC